jgi:release factor glutamine methyltransferase
MCLRRAAGDPVAYIVGHKEFFGLTLQVDARVLVPRPDTETLVDWALELLRAPAMPPVPAVLDLGTGSGAIALAIAHSLQTEGRQGKVVAVDASPDALEVARGNAVPPGAGSGFHPKPLA